MDQLISTELADAQKITGIEQRRHVRHAIRCPAVCRAGATSCQAMVVDVSDGGFGLTECRLHADVDDIINVELEQIGVFKCRVAWKRGDRFGVEIVDDESPSNADMEALARGISKRS